MNESCKKKRPVTLEEIAAAKSEELQKVERALNDGCTRSGDSDRIQRLKKLRDDLVNELDELREKITEQRRNKPGGYQIRG